MERKEEPAKLNRTRLRKMMDSDRSFERFSAEEKERVLRRMDSAIFMDLRNDVAFTDFLGRHPGTVPEGQVTFTYKLREDRDSDDVFSGSLSVTLCELPGLRAQALKEAKSPAEEWFVLFNNMHRFNEKPEGLPERLAPVLERARFINTDDDMITQYMQSALTKDQIDNYTEPACKQGVEDGTARGFVQGKTEGIIEGMAKGNRKARLAVAAQMMKDYKSFNV